MAKMKICLIFVLCCLLGMCEGQIVQDGQCDPNIPLVDNFKFAQFIGTWFEIQRTSSPEQNTDCATFDVTVSNSTIKVQHRGVNDNFQEDSNGTASLAGGLAKLTLDITMFDGHMDFWVLLTNYDHFAVTYSCDNISPTQRSIYLWVLGRDKAFINELIPGHITITLNTLLGIHLESLNAIDHSASACYVLPVIETGLNIVIPGQCAHDIRVEENFKAAEYAGLWYVVEAYPSPYHTGTCNKVDYTLNDDGSFYVENIQVVNKHLDISNGTAVIASNDGSAKLGVTSKVNGVEVTSEYWILATDYDSYALVYSCQNTDTESQSVFSWKLSRTRTLTGAANTAINSIMNSIQVLNQRYYMENGHTEANCFYYHDNNEDNVLIPGQCGDDTSVPAVTNFDAYLFSGTWYEESRFPSDTQEGECVSIEYTQTSSNTFTIVHTTVNDERQITTTGQAIISDDGRAVFTMSNVLSSNIYILGTDYTDYALLYSCRNVNKETKQIYSWKLSRSRSGLSVGAHTAITELVNNNRDLWEGYYRTTAQNNSACFYYPVFDQTPPYIELPGLCPTDIHGVADFDVKGYSGRWFEIARYPVTDQVGQCSRIEYGLSEQILLSNTEVFNLTLQNRTGLGDVSEDGSGQLNVKFIVDGEPKSSTYYIIDTDYISYSLVYSCTNTDNGKSRVSSWQLSRTPTLSSQGLAAMISAITNTHGLLEEYYQFTGQSDEDCFYIPSVNNDDPVVFRGQCESLKGVEDFDVERYLGWWHEIERYPVYGSAGDCRSSEYMKDGGVHKVVDTLTENNEGTLHTGIVKFSNDGRIHRSIPGRPDEDIWILATDYDTYALLYSCENLNDEYRVVWSAKHSKTRSLTEAARNAMAPVIGNNKLLYDHFYENVDQSDSACFFYPNITDDEIIIPGQCDDTIPVVQNFNFTDFAGLWYETDRYDKVEDTTCSSSIFTFNNDSTSATVLKYEVQSGKLQTMEGIATLVSTDESARLEITSLITGTEGASNTVNISILATDYTSYALAYNCVNVNSFQRQVRAWKLSRTRALSSQSSTIINNLIEQRQELHQPYFKTVYQSEACPKPSSALIVKSSIIALVVCVILKLIL